MQIQVQNQLLGSNLELLETEGCLSQVDRHLQQKNQVEWQKKRGSSF